MTDADLLELRKYALTTAKTNSSMAETSNDTVARAIDFENYLLRTNQTVPAVQPTS